MRSPVHFARLIGAGTSLLVAAACSDRVVESANDVAPTHGASHNVATTLGAVVPVSSVTVSPATVTLVVGKTQSMTSTVLDLKSVARPDLTVSWVSEDPNVAMIASDGTVLARSVGTTRVAAISGLVWNAPVIAGMVWGSATITVTNGVTTPTTPTTPTAPTGPLTPTTPTTGNDWTFCTAAGAECIFTGRRAIRLGPVNGPYITQTASRSVPCAVYGFNNQNPAPGQALHCDYGPMQTTTLNNPMPGMSGLNPSVITVPLGAVGATGAQTRAGGSGAPSSDGTGAFRITCSMAKYDFIDPIVFPGQLNSTHLHMFFGNTAVNASSTNASLLASGNSTCIGGTLNRSAYWMPAVFDTRTAEILVPQEGIVYYKTGWNVDPTTVVPFPAGLRMLAGDKNATGPQVNTEWNCRDYPVTNTGMTPNCRVGDAVRMVVRFPQCWDGKNLDSPDHKSHMAFPNYRSLPLKSVCPSTHPVVLPEITEIFEYQVSVANAPAYWRLTSDMYSTGTRGGLSLHGDWMNGWDSATMNTVVTQCLNKAKDCQVGLLGNGTALY